MFDKVVIRNKTEQEHNIHLAVHPFPVDGMIRSFDHSGDRDTLFNESEPLPEWQGKLVDTLYERIPGLQALFFRNGGITLQHSGVFDDEAIITEAEAILRPVLEENLRLKRLLAE